ncbi:formylglycine-generating enzyme family protein [Labilithrix luteola]|uniref:formylglycine-generating enzyme family protein n=1 Tax=Labilithrix luteola TaxID=1391654 RepID=UPI00147461CA|nr:SUMF1/EgtB/PvdO family nonheme iron enzyme [Labilithrix luteola]
MPLVAFTVGGCGLFPSFDELQGGVAEQASLDASTDGSTAVASDSGDAQNAECPGTAPPAMVRVGSFCIDSTEVTKAQYKAFTEAAGEDLHYQPKSCGWNTTLYPGRSGEPHVKDWPVPAGLEDLPITLVNWCQASAYCSWAGKRLCGRIGGGSTPMASAQDPNVSQWMAACSHAGTRRYPYGDTFQANACVVSASGAMPVKSHAACEGGYPGIFDMSGNVHEWEDSCRDTDPEPKACEIRGGAFDTTDSTGARCDLTDFPQFANLAGDNVGFRCCSP